MPLQLGAPGRAAVACASPRDLLRRAPDRILLRSGGAVEQVSLYLNTLGVSVSRGGRRCVPAVPTCLAQRLAAAGAAQ